MIKVEITSGEVTVRNQGSDGSPVVLGEGSEANYQPTARSQLLANLGATSKDHKITPEELREFMKEQVSLDRQAPTFGSASKPGHKVSGAFSVSTDGPPCVVRQYTGSGWNDHVLTTDNSPLDLTTIEANAVTAALYGVVAAQRGQNEETGPFK